MQTIWSFLMFTGKAEAAMNFYISIFKGASISAIKRYGPNEAGKEGSIYQARFYIDGQEFMCIDAPGAHDINFNAAISFYKQCTTTAEVDRIFTALSQEGKIFMPLAKYPFSEWYGWVEDKFGISWQISL